MAKQRSPREFNELRRKTEKLLAEKGEKVSRISLKTDIQDLSQELSVYHIELEMQNDELRRSQEQLEESRSRYFDLYENAPVGYLTLDEKGLILDLNLAATHLLGLDRTFLLKKPFSLLIAPESQDVFYLHRRQVLRSPGAYTCELTLRRRKWGEPFFQAQLESIAVQSHGTMVIRTVLTDITERKQMEDALRLSEERYRAAIESFPEGVALIKGNNAFYVNRNLADMFGYERPEEFLEAGFEGAVHPDDLSMLSEYMHRTQRGEPTPSRYEFRGIRADGTTIFVEASVARIVCQGENMSLAYLRDITGTKRLEDEVRQADKMATIGQFADGMAHDFKNVLSVITCYSDLIRADMEKDDPSQAYLDQIAASSQKAASFVRNLMAFSRKEHANPEVCNVNDVVGRMGELLRRLLRENIELRLKLTSEYLMTMIDAVQMDRILMNLATNATDAMPRGGVLTIETGTVAIDKTFVGAKGYRGTGKIRPPLCLRFRHRHG